MPSLLTHLIRDHHFLEGDVEYGLDPQEAIDVLQVKEPLKAETTAPARKEVDEFGWGLYRG